MKIAPSFRGLSRNKRGVETLSVYDSTLCIVKSLGPVVPSFRALSGPLEFTVRRHKFNKDSLFRRQNFNTAFFIV